MLDIKFLRENSEKVKESLQKRGRDEKLVDEFLTIDNNWRLLTKKVDDARAQQNIFSKERNIEQAKKLKAEIKSVSDSIVGIEKRRDELINNFPNIVMMDVPVGKDESQNVVLREAGQKRRLNFPVKDYLTLAEKSDLIDIERAARVAGSRFGYLKNKAALLELALIQFAFSKLVPKGFIPVFPPVMIRPEVFRGMGRLAGDQIEERYHLPKDDLYLVGSAEHTLGPLHMNEVLKNKELPKRYAGFSTCFRREAGSYGKDTKGILRVHQFDKVEMFSFSRPEDSEAEHQFLLDCQEEIMSELELPYRVVQICTGDLGWTDAKQYDIETWLPGQPSTGSGQGVYRETHSCSNTTDFQARGINCKYDKGGFVHMLNATAVSIQRMIIAIIENYQTAEGDFEIPEALKKFLVI